MKDKQAARVLSAMGIETGGLRSRWQTKDQVAEDGNAPLMFRRLKNRVAYPSSASRQDLRGIENNGSVSANDVIS